MVLAERVHVPRIPSVASYRQSLPYLPGASLPSHYVGMQPTVPVHAYSI